MPYHMEVGTPAEVGALCGEPEVGSLFAVGAPAQRKWGCPMKMGVPNEDWVPDGVWGAQRKSGCPTKMWCSGKMGLLNEDGSPMKIRVLNENGVPNEDRSA